MFTVVNCLFRWFNASKSEIENLRLSVQPPVRKLPPLPVYVQNRQIQEQTLVLTILSGFIQSEPIVKTSRYLKKNALCLAKMSHVTFWRWNLTNSPEVLMYSIVDDFLPVKGDSQKKRSLMARLWNFKFQIARLL